MKRIFALLIVSMMLVLSVTACSKSSKSEEEVVAPKKKTTTTTEISNKYAVKPEIELEDESAVEVEEEAEKVLGESEEAEESEDAETSGEETHSSGSSESAIKALAKLLAGNSNYISGSINPSIDGSLRSDLAKNGQKPYAIVITCSDSRVPAELIFNAGLGEIFVIRTAGNVVGDFEIGSVEYGAEHLGSPLIFVLGHSNCGAVTAATEEGEAGGSIGAIVSEIAPSVEKAKESSSGDSALLSKAIDLNVGNTIRKIRQSEIIKELEEEGKVAIVGGVYDIDTGNIKILD